MTEAEIKPFLKPLAGGQVYPYVVKLNAQGEPAVKPPWIVFSLISETDADVLNGQAETVTSLQIDVYASSIDEASAIRADAQEAIKSMHPGSINRSGGYESDTGLYRATVEVQILE